jgi:hypothetical protein
VDFVIEENKKMNIDDLVSLFLDFNADEWRKRMVVKVNALFISLKTFTYFIARNGRSVWP